MRRLAFALPVLMLAACGPEAIKTTPVAGKFGSAPWTMTSARVTKSNDKLEFSIYGNNEAACASAATGNYLLFSMPAAVGKRPLKFSINFADPTVQTVTFVTLPSSNLIATEGELDLTEVSATSVTLGMRVKGDANSEVNGTLTQTLCQ